MQLGRRTWHTELYGICGLVFLASKHLWLPRPRFSGPFGNLLLLPHIEEVRILGPSSYFKGFHFLLNTDPRLPGSLSFGTVTRRWKTKAMG